MKGGQILVLQMKRIGDLILTAQAVADLRAARPGMEIVLVAAGPCAELAGCLPGVARVLSYRPGRLNVAVWAAVMLEEWEACLDFTGTDRSALLTRLSGARVRLGYRKFSGKGWRARVYTGLCEAPVRELHTVMFHRALVAEWTGGVEGGTEGEALVFPAETLARVAAVEREEGLGERYVILHPGTARREKFWPAERWVEVARALRGLGCQVVLTGTGAGLETEDVARIREGAEVTDLTGRLSLPELAALMRKARLAVGVDSMAMHLASLWRVPQVVLFGPTNPFHWRPLHDKAVVLTATQEGVSTLFEPRMSGGEMERIPASAVVDAVEGLLEA